MRLTYDIRYESRTCPACGETHQIIDWRGAPHDTTHRARGLVDIGPLPAPTPAQRVRYRLEPGMPASVRWWVFPADAAPAADDELLAMLDVDSDGYYYGPGRPFGRRPHIVRGRTRVLVRQSIGWDI